ncbi:MAG: TonB-dependent receptor, partial [Gemmatimonadaceae bacterium]|nr:TonB-dependent receptor [Chitinophagaceae bacterium]
MKRLLSSKCIYCLSSLIFLSLFGSAYGQSIRGKISDENGKPMNGVSVFEKGTNKGVTSGTDGQYIINVNSPNAILIFSFIGYSTREIAAGDPATVNVVLVIDSLKKMDQVVVVGYGTQRRKDLTGAIGSVSAREIEKVTTNSVDKALQGQVAGLQISTTSGAPGGNTTILIRGISSITGGVEPLFVIDGYPVTSVGYSNPLSTINPADIESIDVLKDASATAIYGSRGSNGVIIITTKRGKSGKAKIEFNSYIGTQQVAHKIDLMNAQQFAQFIVDGRNAGYLDNFPNGKTSDDNNTRPGASYDISDRYLNKTFMDSVGEGTDWQNVIFRRAMVQSHQVSVSGGNEGTRYALSAGYFSQDGIIIQSNFKRYSFKVNVDSKLSDKVSVGISMLPSYSEEFSPPIQGHYGAYGLIVSALGADPTIPVYNKDGSYGSSISGESGNAPIANPIKIANEYKTRVSQFRLFSNAYAEYNILSNLKLRTTIGTDINYYKSRAFKASTLATNAPSAPAFANAANNEAINWLSETTIAYKLAKGDHKLDALAGFTAQSDYVNAITASATNFPDDLLQNINGGTVNAGSENINRNNIVSFLGRVNYVFHDKYLLTATLRRDGSSRFGENKRWGNFPSAAIGWRVSDEKFMSALPFISELKIRASYGVTGNNAIGNYRALSLLSTSNYVIGDALTPGTVPGSLANSNLGWESQSQTDIGIDLSLFNNRINFIADYYDKRNKDMLFNVQTPAVTGFTSATVNLGEVQNRGFEFSVNSRNLVGAFTWSTNFNITFNKNKVLSMSTANDKIFGNTGDKGNTNVTQVGSPIGVFYGRRVIGVFNSDAEATAYTAQPLARAGDIQFKDINGDKKIDDNDREIIGTPHPDYFFGFNNTFSFKGFTLDILTNAMIGQSIYSGTFTANNSAVQNNAAFVHEARWRSADNPGSGKYGKFGRDIRGGRNNNFQYSSLSIFDASFFRIRQINIGYSLPLSTVKKMKVQGLRIYAGMNNVHTFTKYWGFDPEVG